MMKTTDGATISVRDLAEALDVTPRTIRNRARAGIYTFADRGRISLSGEVSREIEAAKAGVAADLEAHLARNWTAIIAEIDALPAVKEGAR